MIDPPVPAGRPQQVWVWSGPPHLEMLVDTVRLADGRQQTWHLLRAQEGTPGAVCIALHGTQVVLGQPWRLPVRSRSLELPRGFGEPGEDAPAAARRELFEETGLRADGAVAVGSVYPDTGLLANRVVIVEMTVSDPVPAGADDGELGSWSWFDQRDIPHLMATGEIIDGITLAALAIWRSRLDQHG